MSDNRWARVKGLFQAALDRPQEARARFLADACGDDLDLRREVESLLVADQGAGGFLSQPALAVEDEPDVEGRRIGPYRIVGELGRGGMGTVFRAVRDDETFAKQVALKLVRAGLDSELHVRSFHRERQILARLQHPNIATVLDGGTTQEGRPYLVMEYVEGEPIDRYCAARALSPRARLEMFRQVCGALHYAHQNLVVHRDLKPANLLVTREGTPKLLDFGIAKLLVGVDPETAPTATMLPAMTPEYASPEQVRGEAVTTAADVYSLGVLLYELLTGQRPYAVRTESLEQIVRTVCETEPPSPSTLVAGLDRAATPPPSTASELRGDLDTIVLKALRKEPSRRYGSAQELSEDIRRHLAGLPVLARPDTFRYRATKFIGRHKSMVAGASVAALLIVGFAVNASVQSERARKERDKAERVSAFLVKLFEISDPGESGGHTVTAREMLDKGVERIRSELKDEPEVRATLMDTMGSVYKSLALYDKAEPLLREALDTRRRVLGRHADTVRSMANLAVLLWRKGEYGEAEALLREALVLERKLVGVAHRDVTVILTNLASVVADKGDAAEAEALYREALAIWRPLAGRNDAGLPTVIENLAISLQERGAYAEAEPLYREALARKREILGGEHPNVARTMGSLAEFLEAKGDYAAAESLYREALGLLRRSFGSEHRWVASTMESLGGLLGKKGDYAAAEDLCRGALAMQRKLLGDRHPHLASTLGGLASILTRKGNPRDAEPLFREALAIARTGLADEHVVVADLQSGLADALCMQGRLADGEVLYRSALAMDRKLLARNNPVVAGPLTGLGALLVEKGDPAGAEPLLREALSIRRAALPEDHSDTAETESVLGACLVAQGRFAEAEPLLTGSYARINSKRTDRSRESRDAIARVVKLYRAWDKPDRARAYAAALAKAGIPGGGGREKR